MQIRTRFIIPMDGSDVNRLPAPHFDSDAAQSARPVRPITEAEETVVARRRPVDAAPPTYGPEPDFGPPPVVPFVPQPLITYGPPARRSRARGALVALLILFAVGFGLAGGYAIAHYPELTTVEPVAAAAGFRQRTEVADPEFTLPPEPVTEEPIPTDPDADATDPADDSDQDQVNNQQPSHQPRATRDTDGYPQPFPHTKRRDADPDTPDDNPGGTRQRRVDDPDDRHSTANHRGRNSGRDKDDSTGGQIRRAGNGIVTRIRQIFEGKP